MGLPRRVHPCWIIGISGRGRKQEASGSSVLNSKDFDLLRLRSNYGQSDSMILRATYYNTLC